MLLSPLGEWCSYCISASGYGVIAFLRDAESVCGFLLRFHVFEALFGTALHHAETAAFQFTAIVVGLPISLSVMAEIPVLRTWFPFPLEFPPKLD